MKFEEFERLATSEMKRWLRVAGEKAFVDNERHEFEPFELFVARAHSAASGIEAGYRLFSASGRATFREALREVLMELDVSIAPGGTAIWEFYIELAWLIHASEVIDVLEQRFTEAFLDGLFDGNQAAFNRVFSFAANTVLNGPIPERLIRRMVQSRHFDPRYSRKALLRLCEISPDNWVSHIHTVSDLLDKGFGNRPPEILDDLAEDIFGAIGFDRFMDGVPRLRISDAGEDGPDRWIWDALAERRSKLIPVVGGGVAVWDRPSDVRMIAANDNVSCEGWQQSWSFEGLLACVPADLKDWAQA